MTAVPSAGTQPHDARVRECRAGGSGGYGMNIVALRRRSPYNWRDAYDAKRVDDAASLARHMQSVLQRCHQLTGTSIFGDAAWELMLALFLDAVDERPTFADDLAATTSAPVTTANRYITMLIAEKLLVAHPSAKSARGPVLALSPQGFEGMLDVLGTRQTWPTVS